MFEVIKNLPAYIRSSKKKCILSVFSWLVPMQILEEIVMWKEGKKS